MSRLDAVWIAFAGVNSTDMGVRVARLPDIPAAGARGEKLEIPGRDGALWLPEDAYEDITLKVPLELTAGADIDAVTAWLDGEGELILSDRPDQCYRARVTHGFEWRRGVYAAGPRRGEVTFSCQPFRYQVGSPCLDPITDSAVFRGSGNVPARPVFGVYGSGDISLMVNAATVLFTGVADRIALDCEAMMAFRDGVNASSQVTILSEDDAWPTLVPGENRISFAGDVQKVLVEPRWRWR